MYRGYLFLTHRTVAPGEAPPDNHDPSSKPSQAAQFHVGALSRNDLDPDPFSQFHAWFSDPALHGTVPETVTLSTAELPSGRVSSRMVYLKELDDRGWVIYSNWGTSRKGNVTWLLCSTSTSTRCGSPLTVGFGAVAHDVSTNPYASLCFWWKPLERQVRIEGPAERLTSSESQVYYDTRARGSRIGAWASQQTSVLRPQDRSRSSGGDDDGRAELEQQVKDVERRFDGQDEIPVPEFWGGLRVVPEMVEFWQGRESRLHDRFRYTKTEDGKTWKVERLSP